jgi:hypothetical protein
MLREQRRIGLHAGPGVSPATALRKMHKVIRELQIGRSPCGYSRA